ncbi:hypothetical protein [Sorangium sp. So ce1335]|uniref:hypothetical protein n=1 Tax=Sorangium sp. So ce1335 TaxID=3133335 RepID=UPI003F62E65E
MPSARRNLGELDRAAADRCPRSIAALSRLPFAAAVMCVAASASLAACGDASEPGDEGAGIDAEVGDELRFVHVREDGDLARALTDFFLPHREGVLDAFLAAHANGDTCSTPAISAAQAVESDEPVPTLGGSTTR